MNSVPRTRQQKRRAAKADETPSSKKRKSSSKAKCPENQNLVDALHDLSAALFRAQSVDAKNRFKGVALRRAANAVGDLDYAVTSGDVLADKEGDHKVPGVGKGTAAYIDEFLETGEIYETQRYNKMADKATKTKTAASSSEHESKANNKGTKSKQNLKGEELQVNINRAPVLTLWVVVVAEREGFNREEALTYGKWVSGVLAQSKGRALGIFEAKEETEAESVAKKRRDEALGVRHVEGAFGHMKIPTIERNGNRLAVSGGKALDPFYVQGYLERSFGDQLDAVEAVMKELAESMSQQELKKHAYHLYEEFRPEWRGWGKKSWLKLSTIRRLASKKNET